MSRILPTLPEAIISVAHPDHREELIAAAECMGIWRGSNRE